MALNALAFLYNQLLHQPVGDFGDFCRAAQPRKLPTVLTLTEVSFLLQQLRGSYWLMAALMYGYRLWRIELRLRVRDLDFQFSQLQIWQGKGMKHLLVTLAPELREPIRYQIQQVKQYPQRDLAEHHYCGVFMPKALDKKYPNTSKQLPWQYLFPSHQLSLEPDTNKLRQHHVHETSVNKFLAFNEYQILEGYGSVSRQQAENKAIAEYDKFNQQQKIESDFDREVKKLLKGKNSRD